MTVSVEIFVNMQVLDPKQPAAMKILAATLAFRTQECSYADFNWFEGICRTV